MDGVGTKLRLAIETGRHDTALERLLQRNPGAEVRGQRQAAEEPQQQRDRQHPAGRQLAGWPARAKRRRRQLWHRAGRPGRRAGRLRAQGLGQQLFGLHGSDYGWPVAVVPPLNRCSASRPRLAVDLTVPREMPVASAISASDRPP